MNLEWLKECAKNDYIFETSEAKELYDYIIQLQNKLEKVKKTLMLGFDTQETIFKALKILKED